MTNSLTLPGTIPGLLRRGSPVILTEDYDPCSSWDPYLPKGRGGVLLSGEMQTHGEPHYWVAWEDAESDAESLIYMEPDCLALDLTDATGRAHAAWWLAEKALQNPHVAVNYAKGLVPPAVWLGFLPRGPFSQSRADASLILGWQSVFWRKSGECWTVANGHHWPVRSLDTASFYDLNPHNPRLLSDGSRWVDAEALRRVCLHVAGLED